MELVFLGTNGWFNTKESNTVSVLLRTRGRNVIFDAGDGLHKLQEYADMDKPACLFLSHLHLDHISGLHTLNLFKFRRGLEIICPSGTSKHLRRFLAPPFTKNVKSLPYKVRISEVKEGRYSRPFKFECRRLKHSNICFGYRLELDGKTVVYCADTGLCVNALVLARGADMLLAECSLKSGDSSESWPHLNPEDAGSLAKSAGARRLVLFHFNPCIAPGRKERDRAARSAKAVFPDTVYAVDGRITRF